MPDRKKQDASKPNRREFQKKGMKPKQSSYPRK